MNSIMDQYAEWEGEKTLGHHGHAFNSDTLRRIEERLPNLLQRTAETGCGKSTMLFSNLAQEHIVFALDDRAHGAESSLRFFEECPLTKRDRIQTVLGPTQNTLLTYTHAPYDCVLLDGPHGWPFPEFEYLMFYPHIRPGGFLILDDVNIPTIGRMADILAEDDMWNLQDVLDCTTALFQRTDAPTFPATGDGWWTQKYNRRRVSKMRDIALDGDTCDIVSSLGLDNRLHLPEDEKQEE